MFVDSEPKVLYYKDVVVFQHLYAYVSKMYRKMGFNVTIRQSLVVNLACI